MVCESYVKRSPQFRNGEIGDVAVAVVVCLFMVKIEFKNVGCIGCFLSKDPRLTNALVSSARKPSVAWHYFCRELEGLHLFNFRFLHF